MNDSKQLVSDKTAYDVLDSCRHLVSLIHIASRATEKNLGLSAAQLYVLRKLQQSDHHLSLSDIAAITHTHQSSVSVVVKKLIEKGLVASKSAKDDARRLELKVTAKARKLLESSPEAVQDRLIRAIQTLRQDDAEHLQKILGLVLGAAEARVEPAPLFFEED
ncbi:MAG: MarR family transcriptional regulator [Oligoflexus sp.]|nr:MarR family transcriptional regulator [Oligoflexus sp.]